MAWQNIGGSRINISFSLLAAHVSIQFLFPSDAVDAENENPALESKVGKETIDFKEVMRVDQILASLQRKVTLTHPKGVPFMLIYWRELIT